ncbi:MAG: GIY-YIG nuclease family protein [Pseudomonadota bacterium]
MTFWAYLLRCSDGSYYTGHTDNLEARIGYHQSGLVEGYTQKRRPVTLVWSQDFPARLEALEAERRIKGWTRAKKEALIAGDWGRLSVLARNHQDERSPSTGSGRTEEPDVLAPNPVRPGPVEGPFTRKDSL